MVIRAEATAPARPEPLPPSADFAPSSQRTSFKSRLHNFDFPVLKSWGRHQALRCLNINGNGDIIAGDDRSGLLGSSLSLASRIPWNGDRINIEDAGFEKVKDKLLAHLREAADRINEVPIPNLKSSASVSVAPPATAVPNPNSSASVSPPPAAPEPSKRDVTLPWKLRTRRIPANKDPRASVSPPPPSAASEKNNQAKSTRRRSESLEKNDWPKISIPLTRKEIENDIFAITGSRPSRRPKKRPRILQRQLDLLHPGSWLPSISSDAYRVPKST
ncbi:hypothetical protein KSP40_PGU015337 [Platanthera guangdongensis]|uniref:Uncharacterized protein n=1 Tax=Platanthera guangdongensis TaxID=2320717 RepID=A0ABR2MNB1_9ASPA